MSDLENKHKYCPHCGDTTNGYKFVSTEKWTYFGAWGFPPEGELKCVGHSTIPVCIACGKRVPDADEVKP